MKRRQVRWTRSAKRDLDGIVSFLADRSPKGALSTLRRLEVRARSLVTLAARGRLVPEMAALHIPQYRELVVGPYRLIYRIRARQVFVLAVVDARRSLEDVLLDRLIRVEGQEQ